MTTAAPEVRFRAPIPADAPAVTAVINERERADRGSTEVTVAMVCAHWSEREIELAADGLLAVTGGQVVGYALATRDREFVSVAPDRCGRGIGSTLLRWTMARSRTRGVRVHRQIVGSGNADAAALLRGAGYQRVRSQNRMEMSPREPRRGEPPPGIAVRRVDVERDARELHRVDADAFADNADSEPETFEHFRDEHLRSPALDAGATLVAVEGGGDGGGGIVGYLLAERRLKGELGYISVLGVRRAGRGRGVGTALLSAAVGVWLAAGVHRVGLTVASDNPSARRLYDRLGMTVQYTLEEFECPVSAPSTPRSSVSAAD